MVKDTVRCNPSMVMVDMAFLLSHQVAMAHGRQGSYGCLNKGHTAKLMDSSRELISPEKCHRPLVRHPIRRMVPVLHSKAMAILSKVIHLMVQVLVIHSLLVNAKSCLIVMTEH